MNKDVQEFKKTIEDFLKSYEINKKKEIDYILVNSKKKEATSIIREGLDKIMEFRGSIETWSMGYGYIPDYEYDLEEYLFDFLEYDYEIKYMSEYTHYRIWKSIDEYYPESIYHLDGASKYLRYCVNNGITKEYIDEKTGLNTPDIKRFFGSKVNIDLAETKEKMEDIIKNNKEYQGYKLQYILIDKRTIRQSYGVLTDSDGVAMIRLFEDEIRPLPDWAYSISTNVLGELEEKKRIGYMSVEAHYGLWQEIDNYYPDDIERKKGLQNYLKYCKDNKVTKDFIDKQRGNNETPDIMKYYKVKTKSKDLR